MPRIHVLDKAVAELIAAGEVVERPSSIAKELIENAIDAGATDITVEIRGGGVAYLRVSDNGCGIDREDVPTAFIRHATSKVRTADDLGGIHTLGFRGEALASISAVSKVELTTRTEKETEGTLCRVEGGELLPVEPAGCPVGTTIVIREVFYNTPARMKFLKKDVGEGNSVALTVDKCALSHPEIAFRFIRDDSSKLRTSGSGDMLAVIRAVCGKELAESMTPVDYEYEDKLRVHGYVSKPAGAKASRTYQSFFLNGRYVRTRTASAALEEAFKHKLMGGKYPACVLHLDMDAQTVDVNVHPAKIEVRFADEKPVFHAVYFAVKSALARDTLPPEVKLSAQNQPPPQAPRAEATGGAAVTARQPERPRMTASEFRALFDGGRTPEYGFSKPLSMGMPNLDIAVGDGPIRSISRDLEQKPPRSEEIHPGAAGIIMETDEAIPAKNDTIVLESPGGGEAARLIGEAFGAYILVQRGEELLLVDKHAAHERILYERLKLTPGCENRQVLMKPLPVGLSKEDYDAVVEQPERLEQMGFSVDDFGNGTVLVREVPVELGEGDIPYVIGEIADKLRTGSRDLTPQVLDRLYYSIACKSAVRAGDKNAPEELEAILRRLEENPDITHCPHGRPVTVRLSRKEIEKLFGRLG